MWILDAGKKAFLYLKQPPVTPLLDERDGRELAGQVIPDDLSGQHGSSPEEPPLRVGDSVLVEVSREPVASKGAKVTRNIKLAGRYIVYTPFSDLRGFPVGLRTKRSGPA